MNPPRVLAAFAVLVLLAVSVAALPLILETIDTARGAVDQPAASIALKVLPAALVISVVGIVGTLGYALFRR